MKSSFTLSPLYETKRWPLFLLLCLISFLLLFVKKVFIESETAAFEFLQGRPEGSILQILSGLQYLTIPVIYLWKLTVISFVVWIGCSMFGYKVSYAQCWQVALVSEFIFAIPELIKILWFSMITTDPTLFEIQQFYPLSLISFADPETLDKRFIYPLKALNVFEIIYWLMLIFGVHYYAKKQIKISAIIIASSYVLMFFLWLIFYSIVYN